MGEVNSKGLWKSVVYLWKIQSERQRSFYQMLCSTDFNVHLQQHSLHTDNTCITDIYYYRLIMAAWTMFSASSPADSVPEDKSFSSFHCGKIWAGKCSCFSVLGQDKSIQRIKQIAKKPMQNHLIFQNFKVLKAPKFVPLIPAMPFNPNSSPSQTWCNFSPKSEHKSDLDWKTPSYAHIHLLMMTAVISNSNYFGFKMYSPWNTLEVIIIIIVLRESSIQLVNRIDEHIKK